MADEPETIAESLEDAAIENVRRVTTGNISVESHSLRDQIEADKYFSGKSTTAASRPERGLRFSKIIPPGGGG